ncbi:MAG: SurA N-terminal domain-containing protein [Desulfovibrio sp.]|jgi:parvulin-like peptidyl-prolyl isomerase|nr:SurA N-terminal domain-containing protein [Desulfovibrio sp.]
MLEYIRSNAQSFGIKLAFGLIILVFVFWGVGSFTERGSGGAVASVNGEIILIQHFEQAYQKAEDSLLRDSPGITRDELKSGGLGLQVLQDLALDILLKQEADKHGISVSPLELRQAVGQIKTFQDERGHFNAETYKRVLAAQRTSPAQYEQSLGAALLRDKFHAMIASSAWIAPDEAKNQYDFMRQTRRVEYIFLPTGKMPATPPAEAELREYYEAHKEDFTLPSKISIEYVPVKPEATLKPADQNKPEARQENTDKLHEILDALLEANILNKNLVESAAPFGLTAQKTPLWTQTDIEKGLGLAPDKAALLFAAGAGQPIDAVLEAQDAFLIARVLEITPKSLATLNDVKNAVTARINTEKALEAVKEQAASLLKELNTAPLTDARKAKLGVKNASLQRMGNLEDFEPNSAIDEAIFASAPQTWLPTVFIATNKTEGVGALLCRATAVQNPDTQEWLGLQTLMENITTRERVEGLFQTFMLNLFAKAKIEILNRNIVERKEL